MDKSPNADGFSKLTKESQKRHLAASHAMTTFARDLTIPITFAPPIRTFGIQLNDGQIGTFTLPLSLGEIDGASGCVLRLESKLFLATAEHVLEWYEQRVRNGEVLNWQVGGLRPFDPCSRVAWRGSCKPRPKDIVFLEISEQEAKEACGDGSHIVSASTRWPPHAPEVGQPVLLAGYPNALREVDNGIIRAGSLSAMFRVTTSSGDGRVQCRFEYAELLSFDGHPLPLTELHTNIGGLSGGPVFSVGRISYPLIGVISQRMGALKDSDVIVIETLDGIPSSL